MDIYLETLIPTPMQGHVTASGVWGRDVVFEAGSRIQLLAPSARGKTTLVSLIYGLRFDFSGGLRLGRQPAGSITPSGWATLRQRELSIVFQDLRLFENFSGMDNILVKANLTKTVTGEQIRAMAEELGMAAVLDKKIAAMSWGEKQRIAILRSLVQPFSWLILDEPFSHLDRDNTRKAWQLILRECRARQAGILLTLLDETPLLDCDRSVVV